MYYSVRSVAHSINPLEAANLTVFASPKLVDMHTEKLEESGGVTRGSGSAVDAMGSTSGLVWFGPGRVGEAYAYRLRVRTTEEAR